MVPPAFASHDVALDAGRDPSLRGAPPPTDPTRLTAHLGHCAAARGRLHRVRGALAAVDGLVQPRFLSTLLLLALAAGALLLLTAAA
jgi:hypothetical protein